MTLALLSEGAARHCVSTYDEYLVSYMSALVCVTWRMVFIAMRMAAWRSWPLLCLAAGSG